MNISEGIGALGKKEQQEEHGGGEQGWEKEMTVAPQHQQLQLVSEDIVLILGLNVIWA